MRPPLGSCRCENEALPGRREPRVCGGSPACPDLCGLTPPSEFPTHPPCLGSPGHLCTRSLSGLPPLEHTVPSPLRCVSVSGVTWSLGCLCTRSLRGLPPHEHTVPSPLPSVSASGVTWALVCTVPLGPPTRDSTNTPSLCLRVFSSPYRDVNHCI